LIGIGLAGLAVKTGSMAQVVTARVIYNIVVLALMFIAPAAVLCAVFLGTIVMAAAFWPNKAEQEAFKNKDGGRAEARPVTSTRDEGNVGADVATRTTSRPVDDREVALFEKKWIIPAIQPTRIASKMDGGDVFQTPFTYINRNGKEFLVIAGCEIETGTEKSSRVPQFTVLKNDLLRITMESQGKQTFFDVKLTPSNVITLRKMLEVLTDPKNNNLLIRGPAGCGKNTLVYTLAALAKRPIRTMSMHASISELDLLYRMSFGEIEEGKTGYLLSELMEAGACGEWIVVDEMNKPKNRGVLSALNGLLQKKFHTLRDGKVVTFKEGFRCIGLINPENSHYTVFPPPIDTASRFQVLDMDYLPFEDEVSLLQEIGPHVDGNFIRRLVRSAGQIRRSTLELPRDLSTRALIRIVAHMERFPFDTVVLTDRDKNQVLACYSDVFEKAYNISYMNQDSADSIRQILTLAQVITDRPKENLPEPKIEKRTIGREQREYFVFYFPNGKPMLEIERGRGGTDLPKPEKIENVQQNIRYKLALAKEMILGNHVLVVGDTGTGKTSIIFDFLINDLNLNLHYLQLSRNSDVKDLLVERNYGLEGEKTGWTKTANIVAMERGEPCFFDEADKPENQGVMAALNNILQFRQVTLPSREVVTAAKGYFAIAAMNQPQMVRTGYAGNKLSGEFEDRFSVLIFDFLPQKEEEDRLCKRYKSVDKTIIEKLVTVTNTLRLAYREDRLITPPARTLEMVCGNLERYPENIDRIPELYHQGMYLSDEDQRDVVTEALKDPFEGMYLSQQAETAYLEKNAPESVKMLAPRLVEKAQEWRSLYKQGKLTVRPNKDILQVILLSLAKLANPDTEKDSLKIFIMDMISGVFAITPESKNTQLRDKLTQDVFDISLSMLRVQAKTNDDYLDTALKSFLEAKDNFPRKQAKTGLINAINTAVKAKEKKGFGNLKTVLENELSLAETDDIRKDIKDILKVLDDAAKKDGGLVRPTAVVMLTPRAVVTGLSVLFGPDAVTKARLDPSFGRAVDCLACAETMDKFLTEVEVFMVLFGERKISAAFAFDPLTFVTIANGSAILNSEFKLQNLAAYKARQLRYSEYLVKMNALIVKSKAKTPVAEEQVDDPLAKRFSFEDVAEDGGEKVFGRRAFLGICATAAAGSLATAAVKAQEIGGKTELIEDFSNSDGKAYYGTCSASLFAGQSVVQKDGELVLQLDDNSPNGKYTYAYSASWHYDLKSGNRDWSKFNTLNMRLNGYGTCKVFIAIVDRYGRKAYYRPSDNDDLVMDGTWHACGIPLEFFDKNGVDLTDVSAIEIHFGRTLSGMLSEQINYYSFNTRIYVGKIELDTAVAGENQTGIFDSQAATGDCFAWFGLLFLAGLVAIWGIGKIKEQDGGILNSLFSARTAEEIERAVGQDVNKTRWNQGAWNMAVSVVWFFAVLGTALFLPNIEEWYYKVPLYLVAFFSIRQLLWSLGNALNLFNGCPSFYSLLTKTFKNVGILAFIGCLALISTQAAFHMGLFLTGVAALGVTGFGFLGAAIAVLYLGLRPIKAEVLSGRCKEIVRQRKLWDDNDLKTLKDGGKFGAYVNSRLSVFGARGIGFPEYSGLRNSFNPKFECPFDPNNQTRRFGGSWSPRFSELLERALKRLELMVANDPELKAYVDSLLARPDNRAPPVQIRVADKLKYDSARFYNIKLGRTEIIFNEKFILFLLENDK
ncbi:MAG: AAA family ATPase, partial [Deltaproteobacteria bacterium]